VTLVVFIGLGLTSYLLLRPVDYTTKNQDAQRRVALSQIMVALTKYYADHGQLPNSVTSKMTIIGSSSDEVNLCNDLVPAYLKDIPLDPVWGYASVKGDCHTKDQQYVSAFQVGTSSDGKTLTLSAPLADAQSIHIQRAL